MVAGSITEDFVVAAPAELLWKAAFTHDATSLKKTYAGMVDDVEINGDGRPGSLTTMKFNPAVAGVAMVLKSRLVVQDHTSRLVSWDKVVLEGSEVEAAHFKSQVIQVKVVPAGEDACVVKITVEYDLHDNSPLSQEDEAKLVKGYIHLLKKAEGNIVARSGEFA